MLTRLDPRTIHPPFARYAHGVAVPPGARLVFCSGQLGIGPDASVPPDARLDFGHLVRLNAYVAGREHLRPYMEARDQALAGAPAPASTLMVVTGFARPEFLVEVEAVAAG